MASNNTKRIHEELDRLSKVEAEHNRWRELEPLIVPLLEMDKEDRTKVLSTDMGLYYSGTLNSQRRDEWVKAALEELPDGARLLDAGAGECQYKPFCSHLTYVAQDINEYEGTGDLGLHTGSWDFSQIDIVCDICAVPEPNESFDAVLCTEVLEHVPDPVSAIDEMARLIKPGGQIIITAPFWSLTHFAPHHYATGFNQFFYRSHLERLGFEVTEITANGNFFECVAQELRRVKQVAEEYTDDTIDAKERYAIQIILAALDRLSASDDSTAALLNAGLHVRAQKRA